jgi:CelD/BcsL family acetyltransferase involved in cellulose biosynthesis
MNITLIAASELDASLQATWRALQASHPALRSPYFAPEFTLAVAAVQPDVRIAVLEDGARVVGFFPHQARWRIGRPVGAPLSDHHGVVCAPGTHWDWPALLRASRLASWHFDHLPREQAPHHGACIATGSPALDLSRGMAAYLEARRASGVRSLGEFERKARKLAREVGPLALHAHQARKRQGGADQAGADRGGHSVAPQASISAKHSARASAPPCCARYQAMVRSTAVFRPQRGTTPSAWRACAVSSANQPASWGHSL